MLTRPWTKVESSNLAELALENTTLMVRFKNGTEYHYENVSPATFDEIVEGASVGRTFNSLIKANPAEYPFARANLVDTK